MLLGVLGTANALAQTTESIAVFQSFLTPKADKSKNQNYGGDVIDLRTMNFDYKVEPVKLPELPSGFLLNLTMPNRDLIFDARDKYFEAYLRIIVVVTKRGEKNRNHFEEKLVVKLDKDDAEAPTKNTTNYQKRFELPAGMYKVDILLEDLKSGIRDVSSSGFEIPK